MTRDPISADRTPARPHRLSIFLAAATTLLVVFASVADVWALSSGGRYGGRAGFSQSRRGFEGGGFQLSNDRGILRLETAPRHRRFSWISVWVGRT
jgi:hypothetical protein